MWTVFSCFATVSGVAREAVRDIVVLFWGVT